MSLLDRLNRLLSYNPYEPRPPSPSSSILPTTDTRIFCNPPLEEPPPPWWRLRLALPPGPRVHGFPPGPHGVVLILSSPAPVALEFLGLPAIPAVEIPPSRCVNNGDGNAEKKRTTAAEDDDDDDDDEEEAFCARMRLLAAEWWEGGEAEWLTANGVLTMEPYHFKECGMVRPVRVVAVGFEGGVRAGRAGEGGGGSAGVLGYRVPSTPPRWPPGDTREKQQGEYLARRRRDIRIRATHTMEERCTVIRECGGEYFESLEAWLAEAMETHVREGVIVASERDGGT